MRQFFTKFLRQYWVPLVVFSLLRIISILQVLFWPYAFSKIVNLVTQDPHQWTSALNWASLMIANKILEDPMRLWSRYGLEKVGTQLQIAATVFFTEKGTLRPGRKTGETVQAVRRAVENIGVLFDYYKEYFWQLPINLLVISLILCQANPSYLFFPLVYTGLYLALDLWIAKIYRRRIKDYFKSTEVFWGTVYREAPEVWRQRESIEEFGCHLKPQSQDFYQSNVSFLKIDRWRWTILQVLSSCFRGLAIIFVLYRIVNYQTPVGDLVLIAAYLERTQSTLNIITTVYNGLIESSVSLKRLRKAIQVG